MRTFVHSSLFGFLAASAVLLTSSAYAQDGGTDGGGGSGGSGLENCDPTTLLCSNGLIATGHKAESMDRLITDIDTGWMPKCDPVSDPPCGKDVQVRAQIWLDPPKTGGPVYSVDMTKDTIVDLHWDPSDVSMYTVALADGKPTPAAGKFNVAHTLTPEVTIFVGFGIDKQFAFDMTALVNYLPDSQFYYYASGNKSFPPWGFTTVENHVTGTDLANSQLVGIDFQTIAGWFGMDINEYAKGHFSLNAATDSTFTYQTTQVNVSGATGPIGAQDSTTQYPIQGGDAVDLIVNAKGVIRYEGTLQLKFVISLTEAFGIPISVNYPVDLYETPYGSANVPVNFPPQQVHIKIPNVFVPSTVQDFGSVDTGAKSPDKTVEIENSGELGAILNITSDSNQFEVSPTSYTMGPDGDVLPLKIRFKPTKSGLQQGTITVTSNDPDEPVQEIKVRGTGVGQDLPDPEDGGTGGSGPGNEAGAAATVYDPGSSNDGGCGCTTAPTGYGNALAGLALAGLGLAMLRRKRS